MLAWCELRDDYRNFRVDRIASRRLLDDTFDGAGTIGARAYLERYRDGCDT